MKKAIAGMISFMLSVGLYAAPRQYSTVITPTNNTVVGDTITGFTSDISSTTYGRYIQPTKIVLVNVSTSAHTVTFYDTVTTTNTAVRKLVMAIEGGKTATLDGAAYKQVDMDIPEGFLFDTGVVTRKSGGEVGLTVTIFHTNK
jgi:hypothetical protein